MAWRRAVRLDDQPRAEPTNLLDRLRQLAGITDLSRWLPLRPAGDPEQKYAETRIGRPKAPPWAAVCSEPGWNTRWQ